MLLPQVPFATKQTIAAELGFNLGVLSGRLKTERESLGSLDAQVRAVQTYVEATENVEEGNFATCAWLRGTLEFRVADLGKSGALLFIGGGDKFTLALGGSARHLIGYTSSGDVSRAPFSFFPDLIRELLDLEGTTSGKDAPPRPSPASEVAHFPQLASMLEWVDRNTTGPRQRMSFFAKRLASDSSGEKSFTLATPLYVALSE